MYAGRRRPETISKKKRSFFANGEVFFLDLLSHRRLWRGTDDFPGSNEKDQGLCFKQSSKHKKAFMRLRRIDPDG